MLYWYTGTPCHCGTAGVHPDFCCFYAFSVPVNDAIQPYQISSSMNNFDPLPIFQKRDNAALRLHTGDTFEKNIFRISMRMIHLNTFYRSIGNIKNMIRMIDEHSLRCEHILSSFSLLLSEKIFHPVDSLCNQSGFV